MTNNTTPHGSSCLTDFRGRRYPCLTLEAEGECSCEPQPLPRSRPRLHEEHVRTWEYVQWELDHVYCDACGTSWPLDEPCPWH